MSATDLKVSVGVGAPEVAVGEEAAYVVIQTKVLATISMAV